MLDKTTEKSTENQTILGVSYAEYHRTKAWLDERIEASKKKPSAEVVTLIPLLAKLLMPRNKNNRPVSKRNGSDIASDIANKRWMFNGESIVVSKAGNLLDGQHRCEQVIATNQPIETVIVFGPADEARFTIDTGKSKTVSNFLSMKGKLYAHALGPAINYILQYRQHGEILLVGSNNVSKLPTKTQIIEAADELAGIDLSVEATAGSMKTIRSHSVLSFCHFVFTKRAGRAAADEFITKLIAGEGLRTGSPILYCRNRLYKMGRGVRANEKAELIFKCWNSWRRGESAGNYRLNSGALPKLER